MINQFAQPPNQGRERRLERATDRYVDTLSEAQKATLLRALTETGEKPDLPLLDTRLWKFMRLRGRAFLVGLGWKTGEEQ